jgi:hypothetical protein
MENEARYDREKGWYNPGLLAKKEEKKMLEHTVETITPEIASFYLTKSGVNARPSRISSLNEYTKAMKEGSWQLNGEPIIISQNNIVINGSHRLKACVNSGCSFQTVVTRNVPDAFFSSIDTGVIRNRADILSLMGYVNCKRLSTAIYNIGIWLYYDWKSFLPFTAAGYNTGIEINNKYSQEFILNIDHTLRTIDFTRKDPSFLKIGQGFSHFISWYFHNFAPEKAMLKLYDYNKILASGAQLPSDSIILYLREELHQSAVLNSITVISPRERARLYCLALSTIVEKNKHRMPKKAWRSIIRKNREDNPDFTCFNTLFNFPNAKEFYDNNRANWKGKIYSKLTKASENLNGIIKRTKSIVVENRYFGNKGKI